MILRDLWLLLSLVVVLDKRLVFVNGVSTDFSNRPKIVNIGALFSLNSTIGKVANVAIQAAIDDVNSSSDVLHGTQLNISMLDNCQSGFLGIAQTMAFMDDDIVAIIGPQSSVLAHVVSPIAAGFRIPLLAFAATDPALSSIEYPFIVRTTQSDLYQMDAIADLINYFGWREVATIYTDDNYGRNGIASLGDKLAENGGKISYRAPMSLGISSDEIKRLLFQVISQESRIFVLHTYHSYGLKVLEVARSLQMLENGFVWIATSWLMDVIETDSPLPSNAQNDIQGLLTLRVYTPNSNLKLNFTARWNNLVGREYNSFFGFNTCGLYAYDSVWILAYALDAYFAQGGNISFSKYSAVNRLHLDSIRVFDGGEELLSKIYQVNMTGLTGQIQFGENRNLINPVFEILNIVGTGHNKIGYWSNFSGLSQKLSEAVPSKRTDSTLQLSSVIWPGQTIEKPRGWVFQNNGKVLKIGVPRRVTYLEFVSYSPKTHSFSGFSIDVFTAALNLLPYGISYNLVPFGDGKSNPNMDELVERLSEGVYDAVVGDIVITAKRAKIVDFTQPFIESGLVVVAPVKTKDSDAWAFLSPLTPKMWCVTGVSIIILGAVIWVLEHRFNDEFRGPPQQQVKTLLWFGCSTWFGSHRETTLSILGRFVLFIWLFVVLIIKSSYTASLSSIFTLHQLYSPIKGIESLMGSKAPIGYQKGSFSMNYLHVDLRFPKSQLVPLNNEDEYEEALRKGPKNGGVAAIVDDMSRIENFLSRRCHYTIRGQTFTRNGRGFAFPKGSQLAVDMSTAILKLSEDGDLQRIHDKWLTKSACRSQDSKLTVDRLELNSFWGLFFICGVACFFAFIVYCIRLVKKFMRHRRSSEEDSDCQRPQRSCLRRFLAFLNEKEEQPRQDSI
ncbi:glutamate receptor 3.6-like isoform X1 [Amaranthus tricolor]|uniref:glutamate receptor 3.6-like isoform X1 n=1 Tax=Amaranthus tricolor TaxID=29722 RepID=UPI00258D24C6|nr:glutamate receptor 3.6-like isoform X1 [Amaranthus tricolor]